MSEAMIIQGTGIQIKEYRGKRVVTFKDIDTVHRRPEGTARKRFNDSRKHFVSGVDFFKISPSEFRTAIGNMDCRQQNDVTLITETGYLMLVKSFTDDLAWKVQRELVDTYFRARTEPDEEIMTEIINSGVPATVIATDKLIRCAEIMAGCLEGNRPYVLNILKNIVPNIEEQKELGVPVITENAVAEVPDVTEKTVVKTRASSSGYPVGFNNDGFRTMLWEREISYSEFADIIGCTGSCVSNWIHGTRKPGRYYRNKICEVLGLTEGYFDIKKRKRRTR